MHRHHVIITLVLLLLITALTPMGIAQTGPAEPAVSPAIEQVAASDWRFAHPDATLIGGVNLRQLLASPLIQQIMQEAKGDAQGGAPGETDPQVDPMTAAMLGMAEAALGEIESIQFSMLENGTDTPDGLLLVTGVVDDAILGMLAQAGQENAPTWDWQRIDGNTILLGSGPALAEAAARLNVIGGSPIAAQTLAGGAELGASHDFWISGSVPDAPTAGEVNEEIDGFALGLSLGQDLVAEMAAVIPDTNAAQALLSMVDLAMAEQVSGYGSLLETSLEGTTARLHLTVPGAELLRAIREGQATMTSVLTGEGFGAEEPAERGGPAGGMLGVDDLATSPANQQRESKTSQPSGKKIIIQGLDSGPREIPVNSQ